jgi:nucleotide-binding universal stress UspA family protein
MLLEGDPMRTPQVILVPTDFGRAAEAALDYAIALATPLRARVVLLHAFEIPSLGFPDAAFGATAELGRRILEGARAGLDDLLSARKDAPVAIHACIEQDEPCRAIANVARREEADLVVMGTHGRSGLPRALLGSVAETVVRTSTIPVLTVHAPGEARTMTKPEPFDIAPA